MLDRLASHEFYYFLDSYLTYNQIPIAPKDREKTTFKALLHIGECHLDYAMHLSYFSDAC